MKPIPSLATLCVTIGLISAATIKDEATKPEFTADWMEQGLMDFSFGLFRHLSAQATMSNRNKTAPVENLMVSPLSLELALGMTLYGARGETRNQLAKTLLKAQLNDVEGDQYLDSMAAYFSDIINSMDSRSSGKSAPNLTIANMMYPQQDYDLLVDFAETLRQKFNATLKSLNYQANPELAVQQINSDIEQTTGGVIKRLFEKLDSKTRMVLANAIYFKAEWASKFKHYKTQREKFYVQPKAQGNEIAVDTDLMFQSEMFRHTVIPDLKLQAIELPYRKTGVKMTVILPDEDQPLANVATSLTRDHLEMIHRNMEYKMINLYLPKFKMESSLNLIDTIKAMGATDMFSEHKANFSRITSDPAGLYVTQIIQKAALELTEEGTVAAAATGVAIETKMAVFQPEKPILFRVDRPFLFVIGTESNVLFMGHIFKP